MKPKSTFVIAFIILINQFVFANAKKISNNEIDSLLQLANNYVVIDYNKMFYEAKKAVLLSEKSNNISRKIESYNMISKALIALNHLEEASYYIDKGLEEEHVKNNHKLKAIFLSTQATYYSKLGLTDNYFQKNFEALELIKSKDDIESQLLKANIYIKFADYYFDKNDYESTHFYADKSIKIIESIPLKDYNNSKNIFRIKPYIYFYKGWFYINNNQAEKAKEYIDKSFKYAINQNYKYLGIFYELYGDYYSQTENYDKAIEFYLKSIENNKSFNDSHSYVDSKIAKVYHIIGNYEQERFHLNSESSGRKKDIIKSKELLEYEFLRVQQKYTIQQKNTQKEYFVIILIISILFIISFLTIYNSLKKLRQKALTEKELQLKEKEEILSKNEQEITNLHQKVNESFGQLIEMAKSNSPQFWCRFQEIYPHFSIKMLEVNPCLKNSELTFAAYIYLGFTTKDIANYTHKALKTIENNRYNLRKRLHLSPDKDLMLWLKNQIDN
ncbi:hypothetical protein [Empedobacter tilapiae]|uniref:hypothetical protein n=1 Tax=Empedobacter tilapiae TaxID=2491114 RepID=UPI0028D8E152|nr:hypothetical protein [Empedobacter tilapiae]